MKVEQVRKLPPLERFIYWIRERESIRLKKEAGEPKPWTTDEILMSYRFTNVRRMDDKVSRWLLDNWYTPYFDHPNTLIACVLARHLNKIETLSAIDFPGTWNPDDIYSTLDALRKKQPIFGAAYVISAGNAEGSDKLHQTIYHTVQQFVDKPPRIHRHSMQRTATELYKYDLIQSFMAGQIVADLRWALAGTWEDRMTWAPIGPGSRRGMNRLHERNIDYQPDLDQFMEELESLFETVREEIPESITSRLECHDIQNCLCEISGYEKVLWGQGRKKQRYNGV